MKNYHRIAILWGMILCMILPGVSVSASSKVMIEGVPLINQHPELPTGCEATALTMVLQYYGVNVTKEDVANAMPKAPLPTYKDGKKYAEHPNNAFIGDPFSKHSYGVYAPVIFDMLNEYLPGQAQDLSGGTFDAIYKAIDEGRPVVLWATIGMSNVSVGDNWITPDGQYFNWKIPEHALVMVGYDDNNIYLNDPYTGTRRSYPKQVVVNRWVSMGRQAVAVKTPRSAQTTGTTQAINTNKAYPQTAVIAQKDIQIKGVVYKNLVRVDQHGEWIPATALMNIYPSTVVTYNAQTKTVGIEVRESHAIPSDVSKWISKNSQNKLEAIPMNINGRYYVKIELPRDNREIITYNTQGKRVDLYYKIVDGVTYVSSEWVKNFYN